MISFADFSSSDGLPVGSSMTVGAYGASMRSVMNEAEPFETAAVASVPERMVTACNVPASAAPVTVTQTTCDACSCNVATP